MSTIYALFLSLNQIYFNASALRLIRFSPGVKIIVIFMAKKTVQMNNQVLDHNGNEIEIEAFHPGEFFVT